MGLRTSHGGPFNKSSINRIIQNEMYRGVYVSKKFDVRIEGAIPAIIDNDLWERAQKMFERNRQSRTPHASRADYILSGKLYCGECGCLMKGVCGRSSGNGQMYHYYACPGRSIGRACTRKISRRTSWKLWWSIPLRTCCWSPSCWSRSQTPSWSCSRPRPHALTRRSRPWKIPVRCPQQDSEHPHCH